MNRKRVLIIISLIWTIFQFYFNTIGHIDSVSLRAVHVYFLMIVGAVIYFIGDSKASKIANSFFILATIFVYGYFVIRYPQISMSGGLLFKRDLAIAFIAISLILLLGYKVNKKFTYLAIFFLAYNYFGKFLPKNIGHNGLSLERVLSHMFWGTQGIFGIGAGVSSTYIFVFVLFGSFLKYSGFSSLINDICLKFVGNTPGGAAKVSVLGSGLLGMINGSAVANVATTGSITIPMMIESGYEPEFAAAVEATSSTGGQFTPPIMGAVGFVMAELLNISYTNVILAAALPAFLYYLGIFMTVHLEALNMGLEGVTDFQRENFKIKDRIHLLLPVLVLFLLLFLGYTPLYSAIISTFTVLVSPYLRRETYKKPIWILNALEDGIKSVVTVGIACILIGILIGTVSLTGLGLKMGSLLMSFASESKLLTALLVMILSIILGMGIPGVAAYVIIVSIAAPALIKTVNYPIAAHMFCLVYACLSNITPPVAISSFVASSIAGSDQTKTSLLAIKIGLTGFIIPFFFIMNPKLLLGVVESTKFIDTLFILITSAIGVISISSALEKRFLGELKIFTAIIVFLSGLMLIYPNRISDALGIIILLFILLKRIFFKNKGETF
ncbi:MAG: TRAP transporter fused permease subunit [Tissierellia bacterium]|nr:TRAP transporter fused permease subunit [Tissierellia bacterium]